MGEGLTELVDAVQATDSQSDAAAFVGHIRFAGIDADQLAAAVFREMADGGDVRSGADFDAYQALDRKHPAKSSVN